MHEDSGSAAITFIPDAARPQSPGTELANTSHSILHVGHVRGTEPVVALLPSEMPSSLNSGDIGEHKFQHEIVRITGVSGADLHAAERADHEQEVAMKVDRKFPAVVTLVAAAAAPAVGQRTLPAVAAGAATQGAAAIPDFSGIWAHLTWPDVESPLSGPGPVRNLTRRNGVPDIYRLIGDYRNPILKPQAAEAVKKQGEIESSAGPAPTPSNQCWPGGVPFVLFSNIGMQMLQQRDQITILYTNDHEVRHVRMNQPHPAQVKPSWYGDSVGHYEGDTLVIDTAGVKLGPFAMLDMYGTPRSPGLHVVERYRLLDYEAAKEAQERGQRELSRLGRDPGLVPDPNYKGKGLQLEFTVEDDSVFTAPWSAAVSYRRPMGEWPEVACAENADGYWPGRHVAAPTADKPDF